MVVIDRAGHRLALVLRHSGDLPSWGEHANGSVAWGKRIGPPPLSCISSSLYTNFDHPQRAGPPGENASESATEITAQRHALTPDSPDFEPIRSPATIVTGTRNRALSCTSPGRNVRTNEGSSDGTTLWSKLVDQSSSREWVPAWMDWIGITVLKSPAEDPPPVASMPIHYAKGPKPSVSGACPNVVTVRPASAMPLFPGLGLCEASHSSQLVSAQSRGKLVSPVSSWLRSSSLAHLAIAEEFLRSGGAFKILASPFPDASLSFVFGRGLWPFLPRVKTEESWSETITSVLV
ncbi:hypothetical protein MRS44_005472 [Fusarium solani]|uniref:uncharacterized protein n=1 Tax=Fusarium solani TaxID=169388 RepID=UPI0032C4A2AC|nr:hypothetical protein MRS44_005472 [Fusarium solani]